MTKRDTGFLLIGLGIGLMVAVAAVIEFIILLHHMFIVRVRFTPASVLLAFPFLSILAGIVLLRRAKKQIQTQ